MRDKLIMRKPNRAAGFTLIEILIAVAIVGILSAIAYPNYASYIQRGKLTEASTALLTLRTQMEQYYQDNRKYTNVSNNTGTPVVSPCDPTKTSLLPLKGFDVECVFDTPVNGFTAKATGKLPATNGFIYKINNNGDQTSTVSLDWGGGSQSCWIMKKGDTC